MPLTTEQRIELLKKAREAKAKKKAETDALKPVPVKGRPRKKDVGKTLDLVEDNKKDVDEIITPEIIPDQPDEPEIEPEIIEEVQVRKIKKPKRRIIRKIIKEQYDSASTEEEYEEIVHQAPKINRKREKTIEIKEPLKQEAPPIIPEIKQSRPTLNIFGY